MKRTVHLAAFLTCFALRTAQDLAAAEQPEAAALDIKAITSKPTADNPQYDNKEAWTMLVGDEYFTKQKWPKARLLIWAQPGKSADLLDPANWIDAATGKPAEELFDMNTDLILPDCEKPYKLENRSKAVNLACRHLTVGKNAQFLPAGGGFAATLHTETGEPGHRSTNKPYSAIWDTGYGYFTHAHFANLCHARYQQIRKDHTDPAAKYEKLILAAADQYVKADPDGKQVLKPGAFSKVIGLMLNAHEITGEKKYLDRADHFARLGVELFLGDGLPLPRASNQHSHYEAITGGPAFMHVLLEVLDVNNVIDLVVDKITGYTAGGSFQRRLVSIRNYPPTGRRLTQRARIPESKNVKIYEKGVADEKIGDWKIAAEVEGDMLKTLPEMRVTVRLIGDPDKEKATVFEGTYQFDLKAIPHKCQSPDN